MANVYLVKLSSEKTLESFYKVGMTEGDLSARFSFGAVRTQDSDLSMTDKLQALFDGKKYVSDFPYSFEKIHLVTFEYLGDALICESNMLGLVKHAQYFPKLMFSGSTECFQGAHLVPGIVEAMDREHALKIAAAPNKLMYALHDNNRLRESDPIKRHLLILEKCRGQRSG